MAGSVPTPAAECSPMTDRDVRRHRAPSHRVASSPSSVQAGVPYWRFPASRGPLLAGSGRRIAVGVTLAGAVLVSAIVVAVAALVHPGLDRAPALNLAGLAARPDAAERADRGARLAPGPAALLPGGATGLKPTPTVPPTPT